MDWANERWVRLYTRNTPEWIALGWEAQNLAMQLFRVLDRSGVLDLGDLGPMGVAVVLHEVGRWESEIKPALTKLLDAQVFLIRGTRLVEPNFVPAQETPQSNRLRQAESRARRREIALRGDVTKRDVNDLGVPEKGQNGSLNSPASDPHEVTKRDAAVTKRDAAVTERAENVTRGHAVSRAVTRCHSGSGSGSSSGSGSDSGSASDSGSPGYSPGLFPDLLSASSAPTTESENARARAKPAPAETLASRQVTDHWQARYLARTGSVPTWKRDRHFGQLKRLLEQHDAAAIIARIDVLFDAPPKFLTGSVPDFDTLLQHFDKLAAPARAPLPVVGSGGKTYSPEEMAERAREVLEQERKAGLRR